MNRYSSKARASLVAGAAALVVATAGSAFAGGLQSAPAAGPPELCQRLGSVPEPALHVVHQICA